MNACPPFVYKHPFCVDFFWSGRLGFLTSVRIDNNAIGAKTELIWKTRKCKAKDEKMVSFLEFFSLKGFWNSDNVVHGIGWFTRYGADPCNDVSVDMAARSGWSTCLDGQLTQSID